MRTRRDGPPPYDATSAGGTAAIQNIDAMFQSFRTPPPTPQMSELMAILALGRNNGLETALAIISDRVHHWKHKRATQQLPPGIIETELVEISERIKAQLTNLGRRPNA